MTDELFNAANMIQIITIIATATDGCRTTAPGCGHTVLCWATLPSCLRQCDISGFAQKLMSPAPLSAIAVLIYTAQHTGSSPHFLFHVEQLFREGAMHAVLRTNHEQYSSTRQYSRIPKQNSPALRTLSGECITPVLGTSRLQGPSAQCPPTPGHRSFRTSSRHPLTPQSCVTREQFLHRYHSSCGKGA